MLIKKYIADSLDDAQKMIEQELGPDAVVLTTRNIKEMGLKALFASEKVEVTAAIEEEELRSYNQKKQKEREGKARESQINERSHEPSSALAKKTPASNLKIMTTKKPSLEHLQNNLDDLKRLLGHAGDEVAFTSAASRKEGAKEMALKAVPSREESSRENVSREARKEVPLGAAPSKISESSYTYGDPRHSKNRAQMASSSNSPSAGGSPNFPGTTATTSSEDSLTISSEAKLLRQLKDKGSPGASEPRLEQRTFQEPPSNNNNSEVSQFGRRLKERLGDLLSSSAPQVAPQTGASEAKESAELPKIEQLRQLIRNEIREAQNGRGNNEGNNEKSNESRFNRSGANRSELNRSVEFLVSKGVSHAIALEIEEVLESRFGKVDMETPVEDRTQRLNALKHEIALRVKTTGPLCLKYGQATIATLVGPSGVGKTTTLMKLAVQYAIQLQKRVGIISLDVNKMGGQAQIKGLAIKYGIDCEVAATGHVLSSQIAAWSDKELILVDTSGTNQYQWQQIDSLGDILGVIDDLHVYLAVSATTKDLDVYGIVQQFSRLNPESLVFTKLDETISHGILVNVCEKTKMPISYITLGTRIPEDLKIADGQEIARALLVQHNAPELNSLRKMART